MVGARASPARPQRRPRSLFQALKRTFAILVLLAAAGALGWGLWARLSDLRRAAVPDAGDRPPVPVEVAPVARGPITLARTFSGALEAASEFVAAPKVGGRLARLEVDIGDTVRRGQVVAWLDDAELAQAVTQAEADLAVARASQAEAKSALEIAERVLQRAQSLRAEGVTSESALDAARAEDVASRAHVEVTEASVTRAQAALEAARIRLGYARVTADWTGGDDTRVVAERFVDEGGTFSANTPLMTIVELDPIVGVVFVPERDYARLAVGQLATLVTDAHPGRTFEGRVTRIAPVFRRATRQARVELQVDNADEALKPGMFVRATIDLERVEDALVVPFDALTERAGETGVFVLDASGERVRWRAVEVGVREGERVQVLGDGLAGRVVTLGQELCDDGARVAATERSSPAARAAPAAPGTGAARAMNLPRASVRRPVFTAMVTLMVVVLGAVSLDRLRIDLLPDVELPTVSVRTQYEGASPEVVERLVTQILEEIVATVPGVEEITSESSEGNSTVTVRFAWGTDLDAAAIELQSQVESELSELPEDIVRPRVSKFDVASFPIVILGISSRLDPVEVTELVEDQVRYRFARVPGVAQVDVWGGYTREVRIELDPNRINALGLSLDRVLDAIRDANLDRPAGKLEEGRHEVTCARRPSSSTSRRSATRCSSSATAAPSPSGRSPRCTTPTRSSAVWSASTGSAASASRSASRPTPTPSRCRAPSSSRSTS